MTQYVSKSGDFSIEFDDGKMFITNKRKERMQYSIVQLQGKQTLKQSPAVAIEGYVRRQITLFALATDVKVTVQFEREARQELSCSTFVKKERLVPVEA